MRWRGASIALLVASAAAGSGPPGPAAAAVPTSVAICPAPGPGQVHCMAELAPLFGAEAGASQAYTPADLQSAYGLPSASAGTGSRIAVVDAFDDPNAESDMGVYRSHFGLTACTTADGCFSKVNQSGGPAPPAPNKHWSVEISIDLQMVSAVCPNCRILLVEANSARLDDMLAAESEAVALGATEISNSWDRGEFAGELADDSVFDHPGLPITVAAGDAGYGALYPAASQYVTAVGGTILRRGGGSRGWMETAWNRTGSGCSAFEPKPSWQEDSGCSRRTIGDVSADASLSPGVAVYDTYEFGGWQHAGGTSVAAPIIAGVYALAGNATATLYGSYPYTHSNSFWDITSGSNGSCSPPYLCQAQPGYDGPTGWGTPAGTGGF
ncbi:MAG TPA: S53 family peptidase [Chloroflexota bacterium]|nr:S53 family peptidase [Chloroflexota bacterium]